MDLCGGIRSRRVALKAIVTQKTGGGGTEMSYGETTDEQPLSPAARIFREPNFNCYIIAIMGCKTKIDPDVIKAGLETTLLKHPRFSSIQVASEGKSGEMNWVRTKVDLDNHVIVPELDPNMESLDQFLEDYVSDLTRTAIDMSKPLWELHLLNVKTSEAEAVGVFRIHHSLGDGMSLISLLLACTRKSSDGGALPTIPVQKRAATGTSGSWFLWVLSSVLAVLHLLWNSTVDIFKFLATSVFIKDTDTPLKGGRGVGFTRKRFVHRTVSLDDIKLVKNELKMTINDVVLGVTQGGLSRYLNRRYGESKMDEEATRKRNNLPKHIRLRAALLVNIRPSTGIQALADMMDNKSEAKWGNWLGYVLLPFKIALHDDPLDYVREAKATIDRKKISLESMFTFVCATIIVKSIGQKAAALLCHRILSNTTMSYSNVVGPVEEISFCGHPIVYLAPSVYGHPHALTIHFQSYMDKMTIVLAVDQDVIPDPQRLLGDLEESLKLIKNVVMSRR
ncbi:PREDICTED: O-acyltransferase WSD1-like isoform X2 [Nelumbo nucifera]|uniref:O-acyltransferase WSD1-like isoform X2 n=2 Tax=Nelumbo nucifera TaxID=4432 RepID=A0A1U8AUE2_NELNU|nr:PREDICTED: O-acyltransferase WSD1-like isoform X2 [Nelumbo nucifera]DAD36261.1 TPA_asm: hypothetical protein HUJ06_006901 [Nelumbo nucifera]